MKNVLGDFIHSSAHLYCFIFLVNVIPVGVIKYFEIFWKKIISAKIMPNRPDPGTGTTKIIRVNTGMQKQHFTVQINTLIFYSHLGFSVRFFVLVRTESTTSSPWQVTWQKNNKEIITPKSKPIAEKILRKTTHQIDSHVGIASTENVLFCQVLGTLNLKNTLKIVSGDLKFQYQMLRKVSQFVFQYRYPVSYN